MVSFKRILSDLVTFKRTLSDLVTRISALDIYGTPSDSYFIVSTSRVFSFNCL